MHSGRKCRVLLSSYQLFGDYRRCSVFDVLWMEGWRVFSEHFFHPWHQDETCRVPLVLGLVIDRGRRFFGGTRLITQKT